MGVKVLVELKLISAETSSDPVFCSVSRNGACEPISTGALSGSSVSLYCEEASITASGPTLSVWDVGWLSASSYVKTTGTL